MRKGWNRKVVLKSIEVHRRQLKIQEARLAEIDRKDQSNRERQKKREALLHRPVVVCANENCQREFEQKPKNRIYCCENCQNAAWMRAYKKRRRSA